MIKATYCSLGNQLEPLLVSASIWAIQYDFRSQVRIQKSLLLTLHSSHAICWLSAFALANSSFKLVSAILSMLCTQRHITGVAGLYIFVKRRVFAFAIASISAIACLGVLFGSIQSIYWCVCFVGCRAFS